MLLIVIPFLLVQLSLGTQALQCYVCPPAQPGEDCNTIRPNQVQQCQLDETACVTSAVTLPDSNVPTVTRACGRPSAFSQFPNAMSPAQQVEQCHLYKEASGRVSRTCLCNFNLCNKRDQFQILNINTATKSKVDVFMSAAVTIAVAVLAKVL